MPIDAALPAVVIRCARHGGLGITRTLGRMGVPVYNIDAGSMVPAFVSRYSKGSFRLDVEKSSRDAALRFLREVAESVGGRAVLIPTSDATAMFVAENAAELQQHFLFPNPGPSLIRSLASKREMYFLAKRLGIPTAETVFPKSRAEVVEHSKSARFPLMLKGILSQANGRAAKRMFIVRDAAELLRLYDENEDPANPNFMLQEYIPGGDDTVWMFNGYFNSASDCLVGFTGKKIRQYPVYTGLTSLGICLRNDVVLERTRTFMKAAGYKGILDIGYRYDARDGEYKVLDINPRVGATFRLFVGENGMDVVRAMYLDLTGQRVEAAPAPEGRKWIVEDCDLVSCVRYFRDGKLRIGEWIRSHKGIQETALFAADDPLPALWMGLRDLRILAGGLLGWSKGGADLF